MELHSLIGNVRLAIKKCGFPRQLQTYFACHALQVIVYALDAVLT